MERPQGVYARMFAERGLGFAQDADGITVRGALSAGEYTLAGNISSQFISGCCLLFRCFPAPASFESRLRSRAAVMWT